MFSAQTILTQSLPGWCIFASLLLVSLGLIFHSFHNCSGSFGEIDVINCHKLQYILKESIMPCFLWICIKCCELFGCKGMLGIAGLSLVSRSILIDCPAMYFVFVCWQTDIRNINQLSGAINSCFTKIWFPFQPWLQKESSVTGLEPAIPRSEVWCLIH